MDEDAFCVNTNHNPQENLWEGERTQRGWVHHCHCNLPMWTLGLEMGSSRPRLDGPIWKYLVYRCTEECIGLCQGEKIKTHLNFVSRFIMTQHELPTTRHKWGTKRMYWARICGAQWTTRKVHA